MTAILVKSLPEKHNMNALCLLHITECVIGFEGKPTQIPTWPQPCTTLKPARFELQKLECRNLVHLILNFLFPKSEAIFILKLAL